MEKQCENCKEIKPLTDFYFRKETGKYRGNCKKCKPLMSKKEIADRANAETKVCKHCGIEKKASEYQKAGKGKWLQPYCKPCDAIRKQKYRQNNIDRLAEKSRSYYYNTRILATPEQKANAIKNNTENLKKVAKDYWDKNKMSLDEKKRRKYECDKRYREKNAYKLKIKKKEYYEKKGRLDAIRWQKKMMGNIEFRIKKNLRGRIYVALKRNVKSDSTMKLLGCSLEQFKAYFESLFTDDMNWDNMGDWHIDHIIPCVKFDLSKEEEQRKCFHYTNLQPLWELDNLRKGTSLIYKKNN